MSIIIECKCGKRYRVKDEYADKRTKCPACGRLIIINKKETLIESSDISTEHQGASAADSLSTENQRADSPINDSELDELKMTEAFRRRIRHAAILFRIQFLLSIIAAVVMFLVLGFSPETLAPVAVVLVIQLGTIFLLYMAYKATWDSRRWAPMTMLVLNILQAILLILAPNAGSLGPRADRLTRLGMITPAIIPIIFAIICYRAWDAIPKFLDQPAWCQNTLKHCGL